MTDGLIDEDSPYNRAVRRQMADEAEALRVERWWRTYDAALTGLRSRQDLPASASVSLHNHAFDSATFAHGKLKP